MSLLIDKIEHSLERWAERHGLHTTKDWQVRCLTCDCVKDLAETGAHRMASFDKHPEKRTKAYCDICRRSREVVIEPKPEAIADD